MYDILNLAAITAIAIFKPPAPIVAAYTAIDCFFVNRKTNRGAQILTHHVTCLIGYKAIPKKWHPAILEIEKSTAFIMASKLYKPLKPLALSVWVYQRCWYFPRLVGKIETTEVGKKSLTVIRNLGIMWSIEAIRIPRQFLRPCIFSSFMGTLPIIKLTWDARAYPLLIHSVAVLLSAIKHHSDHELGSVQHKLDRLIFLTYIFHFRCIQTDEDEYTSGISLTAILCVLTRMMNVHDREWTNVVQLLPHMSMHLVASHYAQKILEIKYQTNINA
jgi:hypothetical protein